MKKFKESLNKFFAGIFHPFLSWKMMFASVWASFFQRMKSNRKWNIYLNFFPFNWWKLLPILKFLRHYSSVERIYKVKGDPKRHILVSIISDSLKTSRDHRPKSAQCLTFKNSKRTSKCQSILFYSTRKKSFEKKSHNAEETESGIFQHPFCRKTPKIEGGTLWWKKFGKKYCMIRGKKEKPFWFSSLVQQVQYKFSYNFW